MYGPSSKDLLLICVLLLLLGFGLGRGLEYVIAWVAAHVHVTW